MMHPQARLEKSYQTWKKQTRRDGWLHKTLKVLSFGRRGDYSEELESTIHAERRFKIALDEYVRNAKNLADKFYTDIDARLAKQFEEKLVPAVDNVFADVIAAVRGIEEALDQSKKLKAASVAVISSVGDMMDEAKKENASHLARINVATHGMDSLVFGK